MTEPTAAPVAEWTPERQDAAAIVRARQAARRGRNVDIIVGSLLVAFGVAICVLGGFIIGLLDILVGLAAVLRLHLRLSTRWQRRALEVAAEPTTLTWSAAGIDVRTPTHETKSSWARFHRVFESGGFVFLGVGPPRAGMIVQVVPRRAFSSTTAWQEFFAAAADGIAAARRGG